MNLKQGLNRIDEKIDIRFLILLGVLAVSTYIRFRYAFFEGLWVDEGRYGRIALDVAAHPLDYSTSEAWLGVINGIPPVYPYLLAIATYLFSNDNFAIRIVSPLMGVVGIGLTYLLGREMKDVDTGIIAATLVAFAPTYLFLSQRILIGATLATLYTATVLALYYGLEDREYSKYALYALGPLTALTLLTKQPGYTLGPLMLIYFIYIKQDDLKELYKSKDIDYAKEKFGALGIGAGLGLLTLLPWSLRSMQTCGFPLCSLQRAFNFASQSGTANDAVFSVQSAFYFFQNLPSIVSVPVAAIIAGRVLYYIFKRTDGVNDLSKRLGVVVLLTGAAFVLKQNLVPMALISSLALLPSRREEKLLWLWTGLGIGFMSIPAIKVPRYIGFVIPALGLIAAYMIEDMSEWIGKISDRSYLNYIIIIGVVAVSIWMALPLGLSNLSMGGFTQLEPAGEWVDQNTPENAVMAATSNRQLMFYAYPRDVYEPEKNRTEFESKIIERNISYMVVDSYEKAQANWIQTSIPPYRIPNEVVRDLQNRRVSPQQVISNFEQTPSYLTPVANFGQTPMPLAQGRQQPAVIVYRVNQSALR